MPRLSNGLANRVNSSGWRVTVLAGLGGTGGFVVLGYAGLASDTVVGLRIS